MKNPESPSVSDWIESLLARGVYSFSIEELHQQLPAYSAIAVKRALSRLTTKRKIVSVHKGYYLVLTPAFAKKGTLPPYLFMDAFMKYLERPYYVSLLDAAAFHGAAHQRPQAHFVMTGFPTLRPTVKKGLKISYISIKAIPDTLIEKRKTEAGFISISNAMLTAGDLIQYQNRIGGLSRAASVLSELSEQLGPGDFSRTFLQHAHVTTLQRLGYLFDNVLFKHKLADSLFANIQEEGLPFFRIPLKPSIASKGYSSANRWKIIENIDVEIDSRLD